MKYPYNEYNTAITDNETELYVLTRKDAHYI